MPFNNSGFSSLQSQMDFIRRHGERVNYFPAMKCSCAMKPQYSTINDANRANPNCKACGGIGIVWQSSTQITGLVTGINQHKDLLDVGIAAPGDLVFSPNLQYRLTDYDKIQLTWPDGVAHEGDLLTRTTGSTSDTAMYEILKVITCAQWDPNTGAMTEYKPGINFTFSGRTINWVGGRPADGTTYSIKYFANMDWIVFPIPIPRRERGTNLGDRVLMRKKHLVTFGK